VADGSGNSDTCEATVGECNCVAKPPLPLGNFGTWTDSGVSPDGSRFVVATFNATYGDLMVGVVGAGDEIAWEFVDGVPSDAAVTGDPNGPRGGIAATGAIIGRYASVEVANDGEVTALAGSMSLGDGAVLGIAMGTSLAAGYVTPSGGITPWLNELAFAPVISS
jgi:hypothetical protein